MIFPQEPGIRRTDEPGLIPGQQGIGRRSFLLERVMRLGGVKAVLNDCLTFTPPLNRMRCGQAIFDDSAEHAVRNPIESLGKRGAFIRGSSGIVKDVC